MLVGLPFIRNRWLQVRERLLYFVGLTNSERSWSPRLSPSGLGEVPDRRMVTTTADPLSKATGGAIHRCGKCPGPVTIPTNVAASRSWGRCLLGGYILSCYFHGENTENLSLSQDPVSSLLSVF